MVRSVIPRRHDLSRLAAIQMSVSTVVVALNA
jgi:hypothetical protein